MDHTPLGGGFADPPHQSAEAFRSIMQAMARPGRILETGGAIAPAPLSVAASTVIATLCDPDTGIHLAGGHDTDAVRDWIAFHTGARLVGAGDAHFVLGPWDAIDLAPLPLGTAEYPDRSATVIVEMETLHTAGATLTGPGIKDTAALNLPDRVLFQRNAARFPLGLDFLFTCGTRIAALPRSTKVT
ncbi:phosphonate C-P lyase system protein PhnH [uncultured Tateyamaria sp.]|uniref:phosphonate C-P lyase system protein PhnH n=1 Tax=uncultured Tateyamaria sp. TaxID=455651 RepID=UPI00262AE1E4|nr:phosphonate C-P lyase system protein PhnH [uncultured Tateyamaria sp.]